MKKIFLLLVFVLPLSLYSQNLFPEKWKFKTGDHPEWAGVSFDDKSWAEITPGKTWEEQGYAGYDGFAWYRATVFIPSKYKKDAEKFGGFVLRLGKIDDVDYTYLNGEFLAKTGEIPPHYSGEYSLQRTYVVPVSKIKWDQPNVIAVRVFDFNGGGGIYSDFIDFMVKGNETEFTIEPGFKETDHVLKGGKDISIPVRIKSTSDTPFKGKLSIKITSDFNTDISSQTQDIKIGKNSAKDILFNVKEIEPGFYKVRAKLEGDKVIKIYNFSFAVEPEKIISPTDPQPDFQNYWDRARKELAAVEPQYKVIRIDSLSTGKNNIFLVEMRSLGNVLIRGWYSVPKKEGKYPAILQLQGYGSNVESSNLYQSDDFVSFALNIRGHGNSRDDINPGFPGYLQSFITDKELYVYRGAYMDCVRAIDFLFSRKEVDTAKVVVTGGSQGGALTFATAALCNTRVRLCCPEIPFLSDFPDYFKVASWPGNEFVDYVNKNPNFGWEKVYHTLSYIDIKNLAGWIKAPTLMGAGLIDETCPPHINFAAYNQLKCPKEYKLYPFSGHGLPNSHNQYRMEWIRKNLGMK